MNEIEEISPENNKQNVLNLVRVAGNDFMEVVKTSERPIEDQKKIYDALRGVFQTLSQRNPEEFENIQGYTGDKIPEQALKKVFGAIQAVVGSQEDSLADVQPEDVTTAVVDGIDAALEGGFQKSAVFDTGAEKGKVQGVDIEGLPSREFLQQRMKELGM
jgi:hypothetical protein